MDINDETLAALGEGRLTPTEAARVTAEMTGEDRAAVRDLFDVEVPDGAAPLAPDDALYFSHLMTALARK